MKPKLRRLDSKIIKKISEIRIEERIKTKNVIKEPKQNDTKRVNLKNEFEIYLESLTDEEYKNIMGYERTTNQ
jgi:hypothetical protein